MNTDNDKSNQDVENIEIGVGNRSKKIKKIFTKDKIKRYVAIFFVIILIAASIMIKIHKNNVAENNSKENANNTETAQNAPVFDQWEIEKNVTLAIDYIFSFNEVNASSRFHKFLITYADPDKREKMQQLLNDRAKSIESSGIIQFFQQNEIKILNNNYQALIKGALIKIKDQDVFPKKVFFLSVIYRIVDGHFYIYSINSIQPDEYDEFIEKHINAAEDKNANN